MTSGDWPMYGHDWSRTNYNPNETSINAGNVGQLVQRWQVNIGSNGTAPSGAPSVANGKVFVGSSVATAQDFFAFDAIAGTQLWTANLNYQSSCFNVGIGSTAAISGTMLSVGGGDPAFYGLNTETGQIVWRNPMNLGSSGFPWESPLLAYDQSYLGMASRCDNPSVRGEVRAVRLADGTPTASKTFVPTGQAGAGIWNSPALSPDGSTLVVATGEDYGGYNGQYNRAIVSLNPITLEILQYNQQGSTGGDLDYGTTPVIFHDNQGRTLVGANHKNGVFYAFVLNNIQAGPIWQKSSGTTVGMMPAYDPTFGDGGTLFIVGGGRLYAVDPATGTDRWPSVSPGTMHGNMAIANHLIFANTGASGLKILDENNGSVLRTIAPPSAGSANSGLAVSNGFIYWLSGSYINAWGLEGTPAPTNTSTPGITPTPACTITFSDVSRSDYFYEAVRYLYCNGVISGYQDGTFRPYNNATRAQLSKIVVLAEGWPIDTTGGPHFNDVPADNGFYDYIETAFNRGVISGYDDGTFRPDNNVTRAQLCKIVVQAQGWPIDITGGPHFSDVPQSHPFYGYIETAFNHSIISGYGDGTFRPYNNTTRGQISKIVYGAITGSPHR